MRCSKSLIWSNNAYATAVQIFDLANGELLCHPQTDLYKSGKEVVVMKKYILRIMFFIIVFLITLTKKVR